MADLKNCRARIDAIDEQIIALYEQRMAVVREVSEHKIAHNLPIFDAQREEAMRRNNLGKVKDETLRKYYAYVLNGLVEASRAFQQDLREKQASASFKSPRRP